MLSFQLADDFPFTQARVIAIDAEGLRSEPRNIASMRLPRDVNEGDACDPVGARTRCVGDVYCFAPDADTQPVCGIPPTTCPGDWPEARVIEGNPVAELWRFEGDLTRARNYTSGSCGGGAGQVLYSFTAANSGTYSFLIRNRLGPATPSLIYAPTVDSVPSSLTSRLRAVTIMVALHAQPSSEQTWKRVKRYTCLSMGRRPRAAWRGPSS